jgi:hypothetical protein
MKYGNGRSDPGPDEPDPVERPMLHLARELDEVTDQILALEARRDQILAEAVTLLECAWLEARGIVAEWPEG